MRRKTNVAQKQPGQMTEKLVNFVLHVSRSRTIYNITAEKIFAMDETCVWFDMPGETTIAEKGSKTVSIKSTGHEKANATVCLTARGDGRKMLPLIVFKGAKRDCDRLQGVDGRQAVILSTVSGWMDQQATHDYIDRVLPLSNEERILVWDSFRCHISGPTMEHLRQRKVVSSVVPGGCTSKIQVADVIFNKPFKGKMKELYQSWISDDSNMTRTAAGNLRAPSREVMVQWIIESWRSIPNDMVSRGFKSCGITNNLDGSEDGLIHCFKEGEPNEGGRVLLRDGRRDNGNGDDDDMEAQNDDEDSVDDELFHDEDEVVYDAEFEL